MQTIRIQALPREGFSYRPRAGRHWPSGELVTVEVVDDAESPSIEVEEKNPVTGLPQTVRRPDPRRINRADFEAIKADPVLRILADGETVSEYSQAAMDAARRQASELAGKLTDAEAKLADAREQLAKAKGRIAELETALGAAKTGGSKLDEPPAAKPHDPPAEHGDPPHPHGKGKAK